MSNKMNNTMNNKHIKYNRSVDDDDSNSVCNVKTESNMVNDFFNNHVYCGKHDDGYDDIGPTIVYHYISKERLGNRNVSNLKADEYDEEIWPGDKLYRHCLDNLYSTRY